MDRGRNSGNNRKRRKRSPEEIEAIRRRRREGEIRNLERRRPPRPIYVDDYEEETLGERKRIPREEERYKNKKNRGKKSIGKKIGIVIGATFGIFLVYIIVMMYMFFNSMELDTTVEAVHPKAGEAVNIVVLGMDVGDVNQQENYDIKRTDTVILINYNPNTKETRVVSIPRDTLIRINGSNVKMNAVYQNGGNSKVKTVIEDLFDITVNYIVNLDYQAFRDFIDSIGGIEMEIEQDMYYDDSAQDLHIYFEGGTTEHLNGERAEEFFRWRQNNDGTGLATGDLGRIENQHKFLNKVVDKCKSPMILFRAPKILNSVANNIKTNMPASKIIKYGLKIMFSMGKGVNMTTINTTPQYINGVSYVIYNKENNYDLIKALKNGESENSDISRKEAKVLVLNCTNTNGLAAKAKEKLIEAGYENVDVGNGDKISDSMVLTDYSKLEDEIKDILPSIKKSEGGTDEYTSYNAVILLGSDYK